jgi:hypothetical protein
LGRVKGNFNELLVGFLMRKKIVLLSILVFHFLALPTLHLLSADQTDGGDETITVQKYSAGLGTYFDAGSFNASAGNWVAVYLSTSSSKSKCSEAEVQVMGETSGIAYDVTATSFAQTFQIDRDDAYKITIIKHSTFYQDLTVSGEIIVHHYPMAQVANLSSLSPTSALTPSPSSIPSPANSAAPSPMLSPSPTNRSSNQGSVPFPVLPVFVVSTIVVAIACAGTILCIRKRKG